MDNQQPYGAYNQPQTYTNQGYYQTNQPTPQTDKYQTYGQPKTVYVYDTKPKNSDC
jgi:hypothetical protein